MLLSSWHQESAVSYRRQARQYSLFFFVATHLGNTSQFPSYVVYKRSGNQIIDSWINGGSPGTAYNVTRSGWMEDYVFEFQFEIIFLKQDEGKPNTILVYFDGQGTHLTYQTAYKAKGASVHVVCLPPHTSSVLQRLDIVVYGQTKKGWYGILTNFYRELRQKTFQKATFSFLLKNLFDQSFLNKPENLVSGFRKSGLYP